MPPSKYLLYLDGNDVADALEAIRRVCQPESRSSPHITVRYSRRELTDAALAHYAGAVVEDVVLVEPITFDEAVSDPAGIRTVVLLCQSESLEWLSYKPDYPGSVFHVSLYDGAPSPFASQVLTLLRRFPWNLRLRPGYSDLRPYERPPTSPIVEPAHVHLSDGARVLLSGILAKLDMPADVRTLDALQRLAVIDALAQTIHVSEHVESEGGLPQLSAEVDQSEYIGQAAFWSLAEVNEVSGAGRSPELKDTASFLTPPELAYDVTRELWALRNLKLPVRFGDPAIGPGVFFAALRRIAGDSAVEQAMGVELNPLRANATYRRWRRANLQVVTGDFLMAPRPSQPWTLLAANPPYLRYQNLPSGIREVRARLAQDLNIAISGRSDLYVYFVLGADAWLADGAVAAWVLPREFFHADYGSALRSYLGEHVRLKRLHVYDAHFGEFENARVSSTVVIYEKVPPSNGDRFLFSEGGSLTHPDRSREVDQLSFSALPRWSFEVATDSGGEGLLEISRIFRIQRGIATGANEFFVLDETKMRNLGWPTPFVRPLLPRSRGMASTIVHGDDRGWPVVDYPRWVVDTDVPLDEIERSHSRFGAYLRHVERVVAGRTLVRERPLMFQQERRQPPRIAFVYMAQAASPVARRFFLNETSAIVLNSYLGLTPREEFKDLFAQFDVRANLHQRLSLISSSELRTQGRLYANGLLKLEPKELGRLRFPADGVEDLLSGSGRTTLHGY